KRSRAASLADAGRNFRATKRLRRESRALKTSPKPPAPRGSSTSKGPTFCPISMEWMLAFYATLRLERGGAIGAGRGDTGRLEVVSKSRRQALRSCGVGLFLVSKPHARRSGKAGTPFLRPLLALSSVGAGPSAAARPRLLLRRTGAPRVPLMRPRRWRSAGGLLAPVWGPVAP